jgi:hypothetical protein
VGQQARFADPAAAKHDQQPAGFGAASSSFNSSVRFVNSSSMLATLH